MTAAACRIGAALAAVQMYGVGAGKAWRRIKNELQRLTQWCSYRQGAAQAGASVQWQGGHEASGGRRSGGTARLGCHGEQIFGVARGFSGGLQQGRGEWSCGLCGRYAHSQWASTTASTRGRRRGCPLYLTWTRLGETEAAMGAQDKMYEEIRHLGGLKNGTVKKLETGRRTGGPKCVYNPVHDVLWSPPRGKRLWHGGLH
ncbi:hypothetical protein B0H13DRAFT_2577888 [Mycena leptocephala]|nr:hypothetical protein B0H13DRAFT_2577888 [Mycena leptocephala]